MSTIKDIAYDYYIKRLNNTEIFEKHKLKRTKTYIFQERVFEHLPAYKHKTLYCLYCNVEMESRYVSKTADLIDDELNMAGDLNAKDIIKTELIRVEVEQRRRYRWSKHGTNYLVDEGHRVSVPGCSLCAHQSGDNCKCDHV